MKCRPFLKWPGGKTQLLPHLLARVPKEFGTYWEPFLGGGALFFALQPARAVLNDANPELGKTFMAVRDCVEDVIAQLNMHDALHRERGKDHFAFVKSLDWVALAPASCAARMIYLNKTCFNGLYRVNGKGQFNVAFGSFKTPPTICDAENLRACSQVLQAADIRWRSFSIADEAKPGDFVYFDPPFVPTSKTAYFTAYTKDRFGSAQQLELAGLASNLKKRGVHVLLSNAGLPTVRALYEFASMRVDEVEAKRRINCDATKRGEVKEFLIT